MPFPDVGCFFIFPIFVALNLLYNYTIIYKKRNRGMNEVENKSDYINDENSIIQKFLNNSN
ncbi:hypothetical protein, partial [Staphylococcus felis]|uniref:hypothetical protein n=1 Tax=Staphylococcus felis TaxID=46127 RepID=UPI0019D432E3